MAEPLGWDGPQGMACEASFDSLATATGNSAAEKAELVRACLLHACSESCGGWWVVDGIGRGCRGWGMVGERWVAIVGCVVGGLMWVVGDKWLVASTYVAGCICICMYMYMHIYIYTYHIHMYVYVDICIDFYNHPYM